MTIIHTSINRSIKSSTMTRFTHLRTFTHTYPCTSSVLSVLPFQIFPPFPSPLTLHYPFFATLPIRSINPFFPLKDRNGKNYVQGKLLHLPTVPRLFPCWSRAPFIRYLNCDLRQPRLLHSLKVTPEYVHFHSPS